MSSIGSISVSITTILTSIVTILASIEQVITPMVYYIEKNTYSTFKVETNRPNKKRTETYCSIVPNGADIAVETD